MVNDERSLSEAAHWLRSSREVVVFSGAGASAESGIPTFRDTDGLWRDFPPEQFGTWGGLLKTAALRPRRLARFLLAVFEPIAAARPNAGHLAVAEMERYLPVTVVTQNIDALQQAAGSTIVREIHGSLFEIVTLRGRFVRLVSRPRMVRMVESLRRAARSWAPLGRLLWAIRPVLGLGRRGIHRPNVVLFGEAMSEPAWTLALEAARSCDCMITVGTSGLVMPAAMLPSEARSAGAVIITIDPVCGGGDFWLRGPSAEILPALVKAAFENGENNE